MECQGLKPGWLCSRQINALLTVLSLLTSPPKFLISKRNQRVWDDRSGSVGLAHRKWWVRFPAPSVGGTQIQWGHQKPNPTLHISQAPGLALDTGCACKSGKWARATCLPLCLWIDLHNPIGPSPRPSALTSGWRSQPSDPTSVSPKTFCSEAPDRIHKTHSVAIGYKRGRVCRPGPCHRTVTL